MRENELRKHATCSVCRKKIGESKVPLFWTVKIERHGLKMDALNRQQGLAMRLGGNAMLANVMGPNEEMTTPMMGPVVATVCENCCTKNVCIAQLAEQESEDEDE